MVKINIQKKKHVSNESLACPNTRTQILGQIISKKN